MTRPLYLCVALVAASLLAPGLTFAASREEQEMQRDIAQLQDQVRMLQSSFDQKMATIQTLVQQALDAASKADTNVSVLSAGVGQTLSRELADRLTPVAGLAAKVDNVANDTSVVRNSVADLTAQINKIQQQLTDINNAIKVIQAPPAAPPPSAASPIGAAGVPPVSAQVLWANATGDYNGGNFDMALSDFTDFLRFYPNDPNAATAQFYIGQIHYSQHNYDQAVTDFDAVLDHYPADLRVPDAWLMKGKALRSGGHSEEARAAFQALVKKYPTSDQAGAAKDQLRALSAKKPS
jgi:tol-pal system protein YbgF